MRALWMAVAQRWWGRGCGVGGWTVAFSRPDKSKKERLVINVRKWPRVTGRPSPVPALKRGHLHNHPSHWHTQTQSYTLLVGCLCARRPMCVCMDYTKFPSIICWAYKYMYICMAHFRAKNTIDGCTWSVCFCGESWTEHWVGGTEGSLTTWGGHMTSIFQQPRPWGQTVRHKCIINWALFHYGHCAFISMSTIDSHPSFIGEKRSILIGRNAPKYVRTKTLLEEPCDVWVTFGVWAG